MILLSKKQWIIAGSVLAVIIAGLSFWLYRRPKVSYTIQDWLFGTTQFKMSVNGNSFEGSIAIREPDQTKTSGNYKFTASSATKDHIILKIEDLNGNMIKGVDINIKNQVISKLTK